MHFGQEFTFFKIIAKAFFEAVKAREAELDIEKAKAKYEKDLAKWKEDSKVAKAA